METDNLLEVMMAKLIYDDCRPNILQEEPGGFGVCLFQQTHTIYKKENVYGIKLVSSSYFLWMLDLLVLLGIC